MNKALANDKFQIFHANRAHIVFFGILIFSTFLLLIPAILNGFPLIFSDTGTYIEAAVRHNIPGDRTVFYSLFLYALHWKINLWPPLLAQSLISVYLIRLLFKTFSNKFEEQDVAFSTLALTFFSSLPWFVGQIMPDIFSGLLILSIATGVIGQERLQERDRFLVPVLVAFFITTHLSNLPIAAGTFVCAVLIRAYGEPAESKSRPLFSKFNFSILGAIMLAVAMMLGVNIIKKNGVTFARTGNVMLMAKLLDQQIGIDYLEETCPDRPLPICGSLRDLELIASDAKLNHLPIGTVSDKFLWEGPLESLGGMSAVTTYASEINRGTIKMYPFQFIKKCFSGFFSQLMHFELGDYLIKYDETSFVYSVIKQIFKENIFHDYLMSRQYLKILDLNLFKSVSNIFLGLSAFVVVIYVFFKNNKRSAVVKLAATICIGILLNAFVTGGLSAVHDRYGSRVIWLITLLGLFIFSEFLKGRYSDLSNAINIK
ncbi:MAG: hypothetical protein JWP38_3043 [Herbaspirillum sp.]|nr:hypothetical protein [Herbaspirillum sp.]